MTIVVEQEGIAARSAEPAGNSHRLLLIAMLAALIVAPLLVYPIFVMKILCFALFALSFNLLLGYGGLLSFGHAAFFGMASYVCAYGAKQWGLPPEVALLAGTVTGGALGAAFGWVAIKRQGIYFAMITLALAQMVYFFALQSPLSGGEDGIQSVPRGHLFGVLNLSSDLVLYYVVAALFFLGVLVVYRVVHSPFGQVLKATRDNEARATSLGYRTHHYKLIVFVISATLSGLAGSMKAIVFQIASLVDVHWTMSGEVILMSIIGGVGTFFGPIVGATIVVTMQYHLAQFGAWVTVIQGAVFIVGVLVFRKGILGVVSDRTGKPL